MGLPVTLPQASWPERWQLLKGCSPGPALPCPPLSPSLLSPKKVTPGICTAQALQFCTLKRNFNMAILSYQAPRGTTGRRTAQGPSMMKTPHHGQSALQPRPLPKPSPGPPWDCRQALWEFSLLQTLLCL